MHKQFKILPNTYRGYKDLDFRKEFSIQERHGGIMFTPNENFLTIPPQEVYVFPMYVKTPKEEKDKQKRTIIYANKEAWEFKQYTE